MDLSSQHCYSRHFSMTISTTAIVLRLTSHQTRVSQGARWRPHASPSPGFDSATLGIGDDRAELLTTVPRESMLTQFSVERFSPVDFDPAAVVYDDEVNLMLDAARRAPSAGNSQPWAFIVGRRGDDIHKRLVARLARSSSRWAPSASVLVVNLSHRLVEGSDLEYSEFAHYDLGQAVAHMTFQAHALNLAVHQFRAFDREGVSHDFAIPSHWEVTSMSAVGVAVGTAELNTGPGSSRERRSLEEITWARA